MRGFFLGVFPRRKVMTQYSDTTQTHSNSEDQSRPTEWTLDSDSRQMAWSKDVRESGEQELSLDAGDVFAVTSDLQRALG
jgi:hypothetical protein